MNYKPPQLNSLQKDMVILFCWGVDLIWLTVKFHKKITSNTLEPSLEGLAQQGRYHEELQVHPFFHLQIAKVAFDAFHRRNIFGHSTF